MARNSTPSEPAALPFLWWLLILIWFVGGMALFIFSPVIPTPTLISRASGFIPANRWPALAGIYIVGMAASHSVIHWILVFLARLFRLKPEKDPQSTYYPSAFVGLVEAVLYPTAFLLRKPEFVGVWLALKVAGQWRDWTRGYQGRALFNRFLMGSALSIMASGLTYGAIKSLVMCASCAEGAPASPPKSTLMNISTTASIAGALITLFGISLIVYFEWYRRPRLSVSPSADGPDDEWIHLTVRGEAPRLWGFPRDIAIDCITRISFVDPTTRQELIPQITAHWVNQPQPHDPSHIPSATTRNVGFRDEMIDVLRRLPDGTTYAADPWKVYAAWPPATAPQDLQADFEERRLKQREYIVRVELEPANGWRKVKQFRLALPAAGKGAVAWTPLDL